MKSLIGICGFQGSGKDTFAQYLIDNYGFKKLSFASTVKDVASIIFGWDREMLEGYTKEARVQREKVDSWWAKKLDIPNFTPRFALQFIGTDLFRKHFNSEIWVSCIEKQLEKYDKIIITDCRFENEINMIKNNGGIIIKLFRNNISDLYYEIQNGFEPLDLHPSEWKWINSKEDYLIVNDSSINELNKKIDILYKKLII
jgi:hypothetical protein